jgi:hypothetical protein
MIRASHSRLPSKSRRQAKAKSGQPASPQMLPAEPFRVVWSLFTDPAVRHPAGKVGRRGPHDLVLYPPPKKYTPPPQYNLDFATLAEAEAFRHELVLKHGRDRVAATVVSLKTIPTPAPEQLSFEDKL